MNFNNLPANVQQQIKNLVFDQQFQKRFGTDEKLDYLDSLKHDKRIQFQELQLVLNRTLRFGHINFNPLTLALYSYLYSINSPIVFDIKKVTMIDIDIFFYLLQTKKYDPDVKSMVASAMGYCKKNFQMDENQIIKIFEQIYKIQFRCLNLFPKSDIQQNPLFNIDWLISIVSKVKPLTSYTTRELYMDVSLSQIYYYFANYCRMQGDQRIFIRTEDEILWDEDFRICQLIIDRLIEKNIIPKQQRNNILKQVTGRNN